MKGESEESSMDHHSYTTEEVAKRLKVSKLTVYDLIKKENFLLIELVDRCALMQRDLEQYIKQMKTGKIQVAPVKNDGNSISNTCIISGQELTLDMLAKRIENGLPSSNILRAYQGSLTSLVKCIKAKVASLACIYLMAKLVHIMFLT